MEIDNTIVKNLLNKKIYKHSTGKMELLETHISWVILTGELAYKIKKPVNFGFLDFSTLEGRKQFCEKEIELNKKLAKNIYDKVIPITGTMESPEINGNSTAIEYAIVMQQFKQENLLTNVHQNKKLNIEIINDIANQLADFHQTTEVASQESEFGTFEYVTNPIVDNFTCCNGIITNEQDLKTLDKVKESSLNILEKNKQLIEKRKKQGFTRACHGDLHLGNIVLINNKPVIFDCIEFNESFRWLDVLNDIAFIVMDLLAKNESIFAYNLLNRYLEKTGDYEGLPLLKLYISYRAMVRAKVALLTNGNNSNQEFKQYLNLARNILKPIENKIMITHGLSGSGKSFIGNIIACESSAVKISSDIERKRMHKLSDYSHLDLYSNEMSKAVYSRLKILAKISIQANIDVIIDATFLKVAHRAEFFKLAKEISTPIVILNIISSTETIKDRINKRMLDKNNISDADIKVLEIQIKELEKINDEEKKYTVNIDEKQQNIFTNNNLKEVAL